MLKSIRLEELQKLGWQSSCNIGEFHFSGIEQDSRLVKEDSLFFAYDGTRYKGKDFVDEALKKGAVVFVSSVYKKDLTGIEAGAPVFFADDFSQTAGLTLSYLFGDPSREMEAVGVTGTNGKTTIAWTLFTLFNDTGRPAMYIGTLGVMYPDETIDTGLTTPPALSLHRYLAEGRKRGIRHVFIEASSHGIEQGRLGGVFWRCGIFTNLSRDHLDYHKNMENYFESKKKFFLSLEKQNRIEPGSVYGVIINSEDEYGKKLLNWATSASFKTIGLGLNDKKRLLQIHEKNGGYAINIAHNGYEFFAQIPLAGLFNLWNALAIAYAQILLGYEAEEVFTGLKKIKNAPGRMEQIQFKGARIFIDYAHTPDALENAVQTLVEMKPLRLVTVFGCGGDRDKEKRPMMGQAASGSNFVIITNDNPRTENPQSIIEDILPGINREYEIIEDRKLAIETAIRFLRPGEILLIAGKGHEDYQIIGNKKHHFSDREVVMECIQKVENG